MAADGAFPVTGKVETSTEGGVLTITLADEANRNTLSRRMLADLTAVIDRAEADSAVRVVVLTNRGTVFCAGADLAERTAGDAAGGTEAMAGLFRRIMQSPKPFVGKIRGHAVAGGVGLAAALDISIAAADVKFGFTEVRVGVAPAIISVICLPKMRRADAAAAFLRGNRFPATEAARLGLITAAVGDDELDDAVDAAVADILMGAPGALAVAKALLTKIPAMGFAEALSWAAEVSGERFASTEGAEGMSAYLEKRRPYWAPPEE